MYRPISAPDMDIRVLKVSQASGREDWIEHVYHLWIKLHYISYITT